MPAKKKIEQSLADSIIAAVANGDFDGDLEKFDDAVTDRINVVAAEQEKEKRASKRPAKVPVETKQTERKVSAAPRKAKVKPESGVVYLIASGVKNLGGAKVEFQRFYKGDEAKSVVIMKTDKPGNPKGKRVIVPTVALEPAPASARRGPAKKSTPAAAKPAAKPAATKKAAPKGKTVAKKTTTRKK